MIAITEGQAVVVTERHDDFYTSEGRVIRVTDDDTVPVAIVDFQGDPNGNAGRRRVPLSHLGAVPAAGERYEWADRNNPTRAPFTVGERFERGHRYAGLFRVMSDDATPAERRNGHTSIASAAEIAKFADPTTVAAPPEDAAPTLDTLREAVVSAALSFEAAAPGDSSYWDARAAVREAARAYRAALR